MLKTMGVPQVNEQAQRQEKQSSLDDHLKTKDIHFEFRNDQDPDGVMGVSQTSPICFRYKYQELSIWTSWSPSWKW